MAGKPVQRMAQAEETEQRMSIGQYNTLARARELYWPKMVGNPEFTKVVTGLSNETAIRLRARLAAEKAGFTKTSNYETIQQRVLANPKSSALLMAAKRGNFGLSNRKQ